MFELERIRSSLNVPEEKCSRRVASRQEEISSFFLKKKISSRLLKAI